MADEERRDRSTPLEDLYAEYTVYDMHYEKIGKVDDLFVDENDNPEYAGVKMGFLDTRSTLIPVDIVRVSAFLPVAMSFAALEAGGPDNVTVVVVDLKDRGSASTLPAGAPDDEPGDARHSTRRRSVSDPAFPGL